MIFFRLATSMKVTQSLKLMNCNQLILVTIDY